MADRREFNQSSVSFRAMDEATERIFADIRAGGPWAERVAAAKTWKQSHIGSSVFDGPPRKPKLTERLRGLEPLPPIVEVTWADDYSLIVMALGGGDSKTEPFFKKVMVGEQDFENAVAQIVTLVQEGLAYIDPKSTEAIKVHKMPGAVKDDFPWMVASDDERRRDPWNS
jgi:hypothetical protein